MLAVSPDNPDCRIAFEIQWSRQTTDKSIERTQSYTERGLKTYWISKREVGQQCFQEGVYNFVLTKDCESVFFDENQYGDADLLDDFLIDDFVKKILTDDDDIVLNSFMKPTTQSPILSKLQNHIQNRRWTDDSQQNFTRPIAEILTEAEKDTLFRFGLGIWHNGLYRESAGITPKNTTTDNFGC